MKNKTISKSKLIGRGSYGCVFKPEIQCKKKKQTINKNKISKIFINNDSFIHELKLNKMIQKIPNYKEWSYIWKKGCEPPNYNSIKEIAQIKKCLKKIKKNKDDYNKKTYMLIGHYGGISFSDYCEKIIKKSTFKTIKGFTRIFLKLFKLLKNIFLGIYELNKNNISHQDLSITNIMFKNKQCYIIDFGLSCKYSDRKSYKERSRKQIMGSRIYDPYPLDYIYAFGKKDELKDEILDYKYQNFRDNYDDYLNIHKNIFNRQTIEEDIINYLNNPDSNKNLILKKLDTYSLGIMLPMIFNDVANMYGISKKKFMKCFNSSKIQNELSLLKDMTEFNPQNRISIEDAYERYKSL